MKMSSKYNDFCIEKKNASKIYQSQKRDAMSHTLLTALLPPGRDWVAVYMDQDDDNRIGAWQQ